MWRDSSGTPGQDGFEDFHDSPGINAATIGPCTGYGAPCRMVAALFAGGGLYLGYPWGLQFELLAAVDVDGIFRAQLQLQVMRAASLAHS